MKKIIALLLVAVMCCGLFVGCGEKPADPAPAPAPAPADPGTPSMPEQPDIPDEAPEGAKYADLVEVVVDNNPISNLDLTIPASYSTGTYWVLIMTHERLLESNGDGTYKPVLATEWATEDFVTFNIKLRDDVVFHNGEKFTAEDVAYTIQRAKEAPGSPAYTVWSSVKEATAVSDTEVQLVLEEMNVDFYYLLSQPNASIINKEAVEASFETGPWVGTGMYKITDFLSGDHVSLERNDDYRGEKAITRLVNFRYVPEVSTRTIMMQNKECHLNFGVSGEDSKLFREDPEFLFIPQTANNPQGFQFNLDDPIVGDINFRKAFIYGIEREEITVVATGDGGTPPTDGTIWGLETEFRNGDIPVIPHDPELAAEYLAKSCYNGETIELAVGNPTNVLVAETIQRQLGKIGINISVKSMDTPSLNAYNAWGNNKAQVSAASLGFTLSASSARDLFYPGGSKNRMQYDNPEVNALLDAAKLEGDAAKRAELYKQVQALVAEDLPAVQMFWMFMPVVADANLGGYLLPADTWSVDLRGIYLVEE